jgi:hypothetical protein
MYAVSKTQERVGAMESALLLDRSLSEKMIQWGKRFGTDFNADTILCMMWIYVFEIRFEVCFMILYCWYSFIQGYGSEPVPRHAQIPQAFPVPRIIRSSTNP